MKPGALTYDALGRQLTEVGPQGTVSSAWDLADRRTKLTWPDTFYVDYDYLVTDEMWKVRENGATSGVGVLATYDYDNLGRRILLTRGNGTTTSYTYDPVSRLTSIANDLAGTNADLTIGSIAYNPASQIIGQNRSNDLYAFTGYANGSTPYYNDGRNIANQVGFIDTLPDARGNITKDPTTGRTYAYSSESLLTSATGGTSGSATLSYDPLLRLDATSGGGNDLAYQWDGADLVGLWVTGQFPGILNRYVPGPDIDEPIADYYVPQGRRRWLYGDERGSDIALSDDSGVMEAWNRYDEYGRPQANYGVPGYTGQTWLVYSGIPELTYYKARMYTPYLGRFLQTDPIGYADSPNLYAYTTGALESLPQ